MKCHILRWNPNISSYTKETHNSCISHILNGEYSRFNWSVYNWEEVDEGKSWRKDGTKTHYCDLSLWALIDRDLCKKFSASEMEKLCPEVDWHGGHSGVLVPVETGEKIFLHLFMNLMGNTGPNPAIAFYPEADDIQERFIDYLDEMAPNFFKHFYETHDCICTNCNKICEEKPPVNEITIFWKTGQSYYRHYPENPTLADLANYLTLEGYCPDCNAEHDDDDEIVVCKKLAARIETEEWAKENGCWRNDK